MTYDYYLIYLANNCDLMTVFPTLFLLHPTCLMGWDLLGKHHDLTQVATTLYACHLANYLVLYLGERGCVCPDLPP